MRPAMVMTRNGEATTVIQDIASHEAPQETLALLKVLALGNRRIEAGEVIPAAKVIGRLRGKKVAARSIERPAAGFTST